MKSITKEYKVYDLEDLKQDDELCEKYIKNSGLIMEII